MKPHDPKGKVGQAKPQLHLIPPSALIDMARAFEYGAKKYKPYNWRGKSKLKISTYTSAMLRHIGALQDGEDIAQDSKVSHLGHIMANCSILIDAAKSGNLYDDRIRYPKRKTR